MKKVLAIDMGATSIRAILGWMEEGKLCLKEVMRFKHAMSEKNGRYRWDMDGILSHIVDAIVAHRDEIVSVGIDTWGVDFGFLDKSGKLVDEPICYRDPLHAKGFEEAIRQLGEEAIFCATGTQIMSINTLFQILAYRKLSPEKFSRVDKVLMMPDLISYLLTGETAGEETIWSTSQILDLSSGDYSDTILNGFSLRREMFPKLVKPGHVVGSLKHSEIEQIRGLDIDVISVCGHDTASAVLLTNAMTDADTMFLSCGTWSLFGVREDQPNLSKEAYAAGMTNELGHASTPLFFKNITGLYLLEKFKAQFEEKAGRSLAFEEITAYVQKSIAEGGRVKYWVDMDDPAFAKEDFDAKDAIDRHLQDRGMELPKADMDYFILIYESMVQKYLEVKQEIEKITKKQYKKLHMIGGGAKSSLLCQLVADTLKVEVKAGPFEASALGNILIQLHRADEISSVEEGRKIAFASEKICEYRISQALPK